MYQAGGRALRIGGGHIGCARSRGDLGCSATGHVPSGLAGPGHGGGSMRSRAAILAVAVTAMLSAGPALASAAAPAGRGAGGNPAQAGVISTLAGGVGGPGSGPGVAVAAPCGVTFRAGSFYAGDSGSVRKVTQATAFLTTPAGTGTFGPLGDGGPATAASISPANLSGTCGVAV